MKIEGNRSCQKVDKIAKGIYGIRNCQQNIPLQEYIEMGLVARGRETVERLPTKNGLSSLCQEACVLQIAVLSMRPRMVAVNRENLWISLAWKAV